MKTNGKNGVFSYVALGSLQLAALIVLSVGTICSAQSSAPPAPRQDAAQAQDAKRAAPSVTETQVPATTVKPTVPFSKEPARTEKKLAANAAREGIVVHGHWTIEVKSPDGTVVKHVEFENGLTATGSIRMQWMLGRQVVFGTWGIGLSSSGTSPCTTRLEVAYKGPDPTDYEGLFNVCYIAESLANANVSLQDNDTNYYPVLTGCQVPVNCSNNMIINTGITFLAQGVFYYGFSMSGSVVAAQSGTIDSVGTFNSFCDGNTAPSACLGSPGAIPAIYTQASLPTVAVIGIPAQQPIQVMGGQIISVTVAIYFPVTV
jgi:hypothetical protein